jgi:hypothetical protein
MIRLAEDPEKTHLTRYSKNGMNKSYSSILIVIQLLRPISFAAFSAPAYGARISIHGVRTPLLAPQPRHTGPLCLSDEARLATTDSGAPSND